MSKNQEMMMLYSKRIAKIKSNPEKTFVLPAAHRYGVLLQQASLTKKDFSVIYNKMLEERKQYINQSKACVCSYEFTVLEHLIFTDKCKEMLELVKLQTHKTQESPYYVPKEREHSHKKSWELLCAWTYWRNNLKDKALETLNKIHLTDFCIGWKDFYGALYRILHLHLTHNEDQNKDFKKELSAIIKNRNFCYLEKYIIP